MRRVFSILLAMALTLLIAGCGGNRRTEAQPSALTPNAETLAAAKAASVVPAGERLAAREPSIVLSAGGYTLAWKYANPGDYAQDGKVGIEDLTPIAQHFNEASTANNEWIDGSGDGVIGVADLTPIAMNWASEVTGYRIDGAPSVNGPWNEVASAALDGADSTSGPWSEVASLAIADGNAAGVRLAFAQEIAVGHTFYRIVTLTPDGDAAYSITLIAPSNEPIIYGVSPTSGYQHEEYTFSAAASGQQPLTYAWDFGGGASPNTSSDVSPIVTLSDAGDYSCTLTISNSYGPTTFPFTLTVSARDEWVHTWGTSGGDIGRDITVKQEGNLFVASTNGLAQIMEANVQGDFIWEKEWYGLDGAFVSSIGLDTEQNILTAGSTSSFGEGHVDFLLLKYRMDGELLQSMTWGTSDYETGDGMTVDISGNIYLCGNWCLYGGEPLALVVKLDPEWNVLWAKRWGGTGRDEAFDILTHGDAVYVCGTTSSFSATSADAFLLKMSSEGEVLWSRTWGTDQDDCFYDMAEGQDGNIYVIGNSGEPELDESVGDILRYNSEGELLAARSWGLDRYDYFYGTTTKADGNILVTGASMGGALVVSYSPDLAVISAEAWTSDQWAELNAIACDGNGYAYIVGKAKNAAGQWVEIPSEDFSPTGNDTEVTGSITDLVGIKNEPVGSEYTPDGVIDTGAGGYDVLLVKHYVP